MTDLKRLAAAMVRYEQAQAAVESAVELQAEAHREVAAARLALCLVLSAHGYDAEPEVRAQLERDRHLLALSDADGACQEGGPEALAALPVSEGTDVDV